jgi:hypothetical protein
MTLDIATQLLVIALLDELTDALKRRDGDTAVQIIDHLGTVAGTDFANRLTHDLIVVGLTRMAARHRSDGSGGRR